VADSANSEWAAGWGVIVSSAAGFGLGLSGLPFYTMAVFVEPLHQAFGWTLAEIQGGLTLMLLCNVATAPAAGWLAHRLGGRPVALGSVVLFSLSFSALAGLTGSLANYYIHWAAMSFAGAGTLAVVWTEVIARRFSIARGAALGGAMMGTGLTALAAPLMAHSLIETFGWRLAYILIGVSPLVVALPLVLTLFKEGEGSPSPQPVLSSSPVRGRHYTEWRFWIIGVVFLVVGAAVAGVIPNLVKLLRGRGMSALEASAAASVVGLFVVFGRAGCGVLLDRFWAPLVGAVIFALAGLACLILRIPHLETPSLWLTAALIGLAAGAEFDLLPFLASRYFALGHVSIVQGLLSMFFFIGAAAGPWGLGWLVDVYGGYGAPLLIAAALFGVGAILLLSLGRYPLLKR